MDSEDKVDRGFQQRKGDSILNFPSSGIVTNSIYDNVPGMGSESMFKSTNGVDPFYDSGWDTIVPLNPRGDFGGSSIAPQNEFANSHYSNFSSQLGSVDMMPKIPSFGSGSCSEMVPSFRMPKCVPITGTSRHPTLAAVERALRNAADAQEHCESSKDGVVGVGVSMRKRKASLGASLKNVEVEHRKDPSEEASQFPNEEYDKKQKFEKNVGANLGNEQAIKQAKDNSIITAEPSKENFIHVRAKKGQATNSHSLAERVRRERISERMRLLQELVPGCNKITGKAVMLDEIINYVQSLQQQVEFLSMKLATVNPELEADIDRILSKDILQFRSNNSAALGIGYGLSRSHPSPGVPGTNPPYHHIPQSLWNNDLQSTLQMASGSNLGPNGLSKMEL